MNLIVVSVMGDEKFKAVELNPTPGVFMNVMQAESAPTQCRDLPPHWTATTNGAYREDHHVVSLCNQEYTGVNVALQWWSHRPSKIGDSNLGGRGIGIHGCIAYIDLVYPMKKSE